MIFGIASGQHFVFGGLNMQNFISVLILNLQEYRIFKELLQDTPAPTLNIEGAQILEYWCVK